jgi:menaquinone-dependent protoporphyrinogen oxidase
MGGDRMTGRVLVTYASKMRGTEEIAEAIAREIRAHGLDVDVLAARAVDTLSPYRFVVIGSAIYAGRWRRDAMRLLRRNRAELTARQVWLFQSGLSVTGPGPVQDPTPVDVRDLAHAIGAGVPITFPGRLTRASARGILPRLMARQRTAGDFRDWERIRRWAADVAEQIMAPARATGLTRRH